MLRVLILFWQCAGPGLRGWPNIFRFISRLGRFNSRLGLFKFPLSPATGIGSQRIDLARDFRGRTAVFEGQSRIFPVIFPSNGKIGRSVDVTGLAARHKSLGSDCIYKSNAAWLAASSMQQRLVARVADIGKRLPELPVERKRAVLTALIDRIEVSADQIDIRLSRPRLGARYLMLLRHCRA
jgi:hypothetical protein